MKIDEVAPNIKKLRLFKREVYQNFKAAEASVKAMQRETLKGQMKSITEQIDVYFKYSKAQTAQEAMDKVWKILNLEQQ